VCYDIYIYIYMVLYYAANQITKTLTIKKYLDHMKLFNIIIELDQPRQS